MLPPEIINEENKVKYKEKVKKWVADNIPINREGISHAKINEKCTKPDQHGRRLY